MAARRANGEWVVVVVKAEAKQRWLESWKLLVSKLRQEVEERQEQERQDARASG